jgi:predicted CopG family antitoxin
MVKKVPISGEAHRKLLLIKQKDESFSDLLDRLLENRSSIERLRLRRKRPKLKGLASEEILEEMRRKRVRGIC